jgi:hypothetical protein
MIRQLSIGALTTVPIAAQAAGTAVVYGASQYIGAGSFGAVRYVAILGALTATQVTTLKIQGSNDNSTWVDLAGTHAGPAADGDSGKTLVSDCYRPGYSYVRPALVRGTANAVVQAVIGEFYLPQIEPVTPDSTNSATTIQAYAQAGTA